MKRLIVFTAIAALLLPLAASAQPDRDSRGGDRSGPNRPGPDRPGPGHPEAGRPGPGRPGVRPPVVRPPAVRPPSRPQFSWRGQNFNRYRGPAFRYPPGYAYRRWAVGALLPSLFFGSSYYYNDWNLLGVGAPPPGRRWVRYGPDLLLVNIRTRRIEDVIHDAFF